MKMEGHASISGLNEDDGLHLASAGRKGIGDGIAEGFLRILRVAEKSRTRVPSPLRMWMRPLSQSERMKAES